MPNFSSLAGLKVTEKFVVVGGVEHMATVSNLNPRLELLWFKLIYGWGFTIDNQNQGHILYLVISI